MCGIAGFLAYGQQMPISPFEQLGAMLKEIESRGPDDHGLEVWKNTPFQGMLPSKHALHPEIVPESCLALGHQRLSIIDLSESGHQPMWSQDEDYAIIFNGEIYNYLELKEEIGKDYQWQTNSDTEVILASYQKWGKEMLSKFDGMFAFVLLDKKQKLLLGARDVIGIKPFYFKDEDRLFAFASEPKALRPIGNADYYFDDTYLSEFLLLGVSDHDQGSMIRGVNQLKGGHYIQIDISTGSKEIKPYYSCHDRIRNISVSSFIESLETAIKRQLRADVPIGTSLSGGIDSSTIATVIGHMLDKNKSAYHALTFTFPNFPDDESELAKRVASNSGLQWHPVIPELNAMPFDLEQMIISMGEPFSSLSMFAQYKVMQKAQQLGVKVMLDGQGGDELYLGYPRVAQRVMMKYLKDFQIASFWKEWKGLNDHLSISYFHSLAGNVYFNAKSIAFRRRYHAVSRYVDKDYLSAARNEIIEDFYDQKSVLEKQKDELFKYCLPRLLRYADRNSMAFSIESRVPHLSNIMIDLALQLPIDQKVKNGWTKYILRKSMQNKVPDPILWNTQKKGFGVPQKFWLSQINHKAQSWVESLPDNSPLNKKTLFKDLRGEPGNKHLWPIISTAALYSLSGIKF